MADYGNTVTIVTINRLLLAANSGGILFCWDGGIQFFESRSPNVSARLGLAGGLFEI
jgi:hypothetical protein